MDQSKPLKEGFLQKSHPKEGLFSVTIWQKRYFVLWPTGTMEYYSGYNKRADEYCGTINLEKCEDMVAPTSIGKRHNIIRLTVRLKDGKVKDFCLDCDYPQLLNEWVSSLAEASGLVSDNDSPGETMKQRSLSYTEPQASLPINRRPLPQPPAQPRFEYEIPQSHFTGDGRPLSVGSNYEEIQTKSPTCQENDEEEEDLPPIQPRRYSRSKSLKRQTDSAANISNQNLLKRGAIPSHLSSSPNSQPSVHPPHSSSSVKPGPPPLSAKPKPPPKSQPNPFGLPGNPELQKRVQQRRQEMYGQVDTVQDTNDGGPQEGYEEVQFTTEPTKNIAHKDDWIENQEGYVDVEKPDSDGEAYLPVDPHNGRITPSSPRTFDNFYPPPPPLPPREKDQSPPPLPPSRVSPMMKRREAPLSEHESTKRLPRSRECSPTPLLPPSRMHESQRSISPPPLPPHRMESSPILDTHELSPPPPQVPRRQSSQKQVQSSPRVDKPRKRILPYQTVDLNDTPSNSTAAASPEDNTDRQPVALPPPGSKPSYPRPPIPPPSAAGKPPPPTKKKPMKPAVSDMSHNTRQLSRLSPQQSSSMKETHTNSSGVSIPVSSQSSSSLHSPSKRPPAVVPRVKPKPLPAAKPFSHIISGESAMSRSLPTSDIASRPPMALPPPSIKLTNGDAPHSRSTHKRPPLPPPKPKLS